MVNFSVTILAKLRFSETNDKILRFQSNLFLIKIPTQAYFFIFLCKKHCSSYIRLFPPCWLLLLLVLKRRKVKSSWSLSRLKILRKRSTRGGICQTLYEFHRWQFFFFSLPSLSLALSSFWWQVFPNIFCGYPPLVGSTKSPL